MAITRLQGYAPFHFVNSALRCIAVGAAVLGCICDVRAMEVDSPQFLTEAPNLDLLGPACGVTIPECLGVSVLREGRPVKSDHPEFIVGIPSTLVVTWLAGSEQAETFDIVVSLKGSGPEVSFRQTVDASAWQTGLTFETPIEIAVPRFTHAGDGTMTIAIDEKPASQAATAVYRGSSYTHPIVTRSTIDHAEIVRLFGEDTQSLGASFRLATGARVPVKCPSEDGRTYRAIAIISALHHSFRFEQGEPVARITFQDKSGHSEEVIVRAGIDTSLSEYDVPRPGTFGLEQAPIATSRPHPGDRLTWKKQPLTLYTYRAVLPFAQAITPTSIEVQYLGDKGVLDVYDMILVSGESRPSGTSR